MNLSDGLSALSGTASALSGGISQNSFSRMIGKYDNFASPECEIKINKKSIKNEEKINIIYIDAELSTGFEASCVSLHAVLQDDEGVICFQEEMLNKYFLLGARIDVSMGYAGTVYDVFVGYISSISYAFDNHTGKHLVVECLDVKGLMMNNLTVASRKERGYDQCVRAIAAQYTTYMNGTSIDSTETLDEKIEITGESDYEFIVSAAKRMGYLFYISKGKLIFGKQKKETVALTIDNSATAESFNISFDLTGLAKSVEVRGTDDAKGKGISGKAISNAKFSRGSYAAKALSKAKRVYIDETVSSAQQAKQQAEVRLDEINSHFGEMQWATNGLPELLPGQQLKLDLECRDLKRTYNIDRVRHRIGVDEFTTQIEARVGKL